MMNNAVDFRRSLIALILLLAAAATACGGATEEGDSHSTTDDGGILEEEPTALADESDEADESDQADSDELDDSDGVAVLDPEDSDEAKDSGTGAKEQTGTDTDDSETASKTPSTGSSSNANDDNPLAFLNRSDMRAMWIWSESPSAKDIVENVGGAQDELLQFAAAPHGDSSRALNRLYLEARIHSNTDRWSQARAVEYDPLTDASKQADMRKFLRRAHEKGMDVEYLDGQAIWVASDALAEVPKQICKDIAAFNQTTSDVAERFDGVHFDIEPHTVREGPYAGMWWENRLPGGYNAEWTQRWKDILNSCRKTFDDYEAQTGHKLILASDVGADYAHYNKPILEYFNGPNSPIDYLGIMNYYDNRPNANGQPSFFFGESEGEEVTGGVEQNLQYWTNMPLVFGMETGPTQIAPDWMSFYQEGVSAMNQVIDQLQSDYGNTPALGVAIHHYSPNSYKDMKQ